MHCPRINLLKHPYLVQQDKLLQSLPSQNIIYIMRIPINTMKISIMSLFYLQGELSDYKNQLEI